eukprot:GFKZ01014355.1.p1 GENE.GFKZ01014355.1~~GFKZ01014355.1.p1  ORF type:complete len:441 (+),score=77.36 GFKZ01014355.1:273-1595(+)
MDHRQEQLFNHAIRTVAFHFTKIGEAMQRYADDSDTLLSGRAPPPRNPRYEPCAEEPPRAAGARSARRKEQTLPPPKSKLWDRLNPPSSDLPSYPPSNSTQYHPASYHDGSPPNYLYPPADSEIHADYKSVQRRRKRHASDVPTFLRKEGLDDKVAAPTEHRPSKRVRINWSEAENKIFFGTVTKFSHLDEASLLKELVKDMGGARTWIQCKGHFRNLVVVGRIAYRETHPKGWVVSDDAKGKRASPRSVALNQVSATQKDEGRSEEPGKVVEVDTASPVNTEKGKDAGEGSEPGNIDTDDRHSGEHSDKDEDSDFDVDEDDDTMAPDMELPMMEVRKPTPSSDDMNQRAGGSSIAEDGNEVFQRRADVEGESTASSPKGESAKRREPSINPSNRMGNTGGTPRPKGGWIRRRTARPNFQNPPRSTTQVARKRARREDEE